MRGARTLSQIAPSQGWPKHPIWVGLLLAFGFASVTEAQNEEPDAGNDQSLISAVADVWLRSHAFVWEGPRRMVSEIAPPSAHLRAVTPEAVIFGARETAVPAADIRVAKDALSFARSALADRGWASLPSAPFEVYVTRGGNLAAPRSHVRSLFSERGLDRAEVFVTVDEGLLTFDPEACAVEAYGRAILLALDPAESLAWRSATARALTRDLLGRTCTEPFAHAEHSALSDPVTLDYVRSNVPLLQLWELGQQLTWEGAGLRASPHLWQVLAYVVQARERERLASDVWLQFLERLVKARMRIHVPAKHPPFSGKTRRIWGSSEGLEPLGIEGVRFEASAGRPLQVWLRGEPGTRWLLVAVALDANAKTLTAVTAASKNRLDSSAENAVYHPLETPPNTKEVVIWAANLGADPGALSTPALHRRGYHFVIARAK